MSYHVVMFGAEWCQPCKQTRPHVEDMAAENGATFEYVDIESGDPRAAGLTSVPVIRVTDDAGTLAHEHRGGASRAILDHVLTAITER